MPSNQSRFRRKTTITEKEANPKSINFSHSAFNFFFSGSNPKFIGKVPMKGSKRKAALKVAKFTRCPCLIKLNSGVRCRRLMEKYLHQPSWHESTDFKMRRSFAMMRVECNFNFASSQNICPFNSTLSKPLLCSE